MPPQDKIEERTLVIINDMLAERSIGRRVASYDQLSGIGLASVDMVSLMLAVEAEFDIMIPQSDITPEAFASVAAISALVERVRLAG